MGELNTTLGELNTHNATLTPKFRYSDQALETEKPQLQRVKDNVQRCGFTWDDAAAKCGRPCPYGLGSECDDKAARLPQNSSWSNHAYGCYVRVTIRT